MRVKKNYVPRTVELTCEGNRKEIGLLNNSNLHPFPENDFDDELQCVF